MKLGNKNLLLWPLFIPIIGLKAGGFDIVAYRLQVSLSLLFILRQPRSCRTEILPNEWLVIKRHGFPFNLPKRYPVNGMFVVFNDSRKSLRISEVWYISVVFSWDSKKATESAIFYYYCPLKVHTSL